MDLQVQERPSMRQLCTCVLPGRPTFTWKLYVTCKYPYPKYQCAAPPAVDSEIRAQHRTLRLWVKKPVQARRNLKDVVEPFCFQTVCIQVTTSLRGDQHVAARQYSRNGMPWTAEWPLPQRTLVVLATPCPAQHRNVGQNTKNSGIAKQAPQAKHSSGCWYCRQQWERDRTVEIETAGHGQNTCSGIRQNKTRDSENSWWQADDQEDGHD